MRQTIFEYSYRDASNYKAHGAVVLSGQMSSSEQQAIQDCFEVGQFFIAGQIGLPDLRAKLWSWSGGKPNRDDHEWHEFRAIREATEGDIAELPVWGTAADFVSKIMTVENWRPDLYR